MTGPIQRACLSAAVLALAVIACGDVIGTGTDDTPASFDAIDGETITETVGGATVLAVEVSNAAGEAVAGVDIDWEVVDGGGSLASAVVPTDDEGVSRVTWTLGTTAGEQKARASVEGLGSVDFIADAQPGAPAAATVRSGDGQWGRVGQLLDYPIEFMVLDEYDNVTAWEGVEFDADGTVTPLGVDADGVLSVEWRLDTVAGEQALIASGGGLEEQVTAYAEEGDPASIVKREGDGQSGRPEIPLADSLIVRVIDEYGNPAGASVSFETDDGGSFSPGYVELDSTGVARTRWTLGDTTGTQTATVVVNGYDHVTAEFTATAIPFEVGDFTMRYDGPFMGSGMYLDSVHVEFEAPLPASTESVSWAYTQDRAGYGGLAEFSTEESPARTFWFSNLRTPTFLRVRLTVTENTGATAVLEDTLELPVLRASGTLQWDGRTYDVLASQEPYFPHSWRVWSMWGGPQYLRFRFDNGTEQDASDLPGIIMHVSGNAPGETPQAMAQTGEYEPVTDGTGRRRFFLSIDGYETFDDDGGHVSSGAMTLVGLDRADDDVIVGIELEATLRNTDGVEKPAVITLDYVPSYCLFHSCE